MREVALLAGLTVDVTAAAATLQRWLDWRHNETDTAEVPADTALRHDSDADVAVAVHAGDDDSGAAVVLPTDLGGAVHALMAERHRASVVCVAVDGAELGCVAWSDVFERHRAVVVVVDGAAHSVVCEVRRPGQHRPQWRAVGQLRSTP
jgi:hypothetical protein